jgi:putative transposase
MKIAHLKGGKEDMAHSYVSIIIHYAFSTKNREKIISPEIQGRLWAYMGGIARENNMKALSIGGVEDHAHVLLSLPATISIAKAIQLIKGGSSKWIHDTFPSLKSFAWQVGYGAFSVSISRVNKTINYIKNQKEHHRRKAFEEEYLAFLKKHSIEYDEKYIWG